MIVSFVESIHNISKGFLAYDDRHDITAHQCSVDVIELNSNPLAVHLTDSKESLLEKYQKLYELEEMPTARVTRPQATVTPAVPPIAQPAASETFGDRARRLFNERDAASASTHDTTMDIIVRPAEREPPPQPDTIIDEALYIKIKTNLEVIFVLGWEEFILQYQFKKLDKGLP